jgi:Na+/H+-dicarboxylate symporter
MPARIPTNIAVIRSEMKALSLAFNTRSSSSATPAATIRIMDETDMVDLNV